MKGGDYGGIPAASVQSAGYVLAVGPFQKLNTN